MVDPNFQEHFRSLGFILNSVGGGSLFGIFLASMFVSYIIPLPEAVLLLFIGFIARSTGINFLEVSLASIAGTMIGDNILYRLSFFGNTLMQRFNRKLRANKLIQYEHLVVDNAGKTILFLRLFTGVRFFGPVISGTLGVIWRRFFLYNTISTILHSVFFITLGFLIHRRIFSTIAVVEIIRNIMFFSSVFFVGILLRIFSSKK